MSVLLESSEEYGGGVSIDGIGKIKMNSPSAKMYCWREKSNDYAGGKVHAKVAVADERTSFISSANLTGYAMEKNMEAGVLIRGGAISKTLHKHLDALATTKKIQRV